MVADEQIAPTYRDARLRMLDIVAGLGPGDAERTVQACPAWTVHDLLAHVTGIAADLSSGNRPTRGDTEAWVDRQIAERRERSMAELAAEWNVVGPAFETMIAAMPSRLWGLAYDTVVHEHDLRTAVGQAGERASAGVQVAALLGLRLVEGDLRTAGLGAVRVVVDGVAHDVGELLPDAAPEFELRVSAFEALRLLGSRRTLAEWGAADFSGDLSRYLPGLVHMDLPVVSLGE